jgi:hypothetical protein
MVSLLSWIVEFQVVYGKACCQERTLKQHM